MKKDGIIVQVKNAKLRNFRNNLRRMWLYLVARQDDAINIKSYSESYIRFSSYADEKLKEYISRVNKFSICICPTCLNYKNNMVWNALSETWYCEVCYQTIFKNVKIPSNLPSLLDGVEDWTIPLNKFFTHLSKEDFARIILCEEFDFLDLIIKKAVETIRKWELFDLGIFFPEGTKQISPIMSKKLADILREGDIQKTESFIGLHFHFYMLFRDFVKLPDEIKKHFFIMIQNIAWEYYDGDHPHVVWQLGQIKHLESRYIREHVAEIIRKGEAKEIRDLILNGWFDLLNEIDSTLLWEDPDFDLIDLSIKINREKDKDWYDYPIHFPKSIFRGNKLQIRNKVKKILDMENREDIKLLFTLKYIDYLTEDDINLLLKDHKFIEIMYYLERYTYPDEEAGKEIDEFFKKHEHVFKISLNPIIIEILTAGDLEKIFRMWDYGWLGNLPVKRFLEIAEMKDLHFFEKLCLAVYHHGYEKDYDHTCALFPLFRNLLQMPLVVRNALKPHIISILRSGKMEALIPMMGSHYLEILDVDEIMELIKDKEVRLLELMKNASKNHDSELHYYNEMFFNWIDRFSNFLIKFDLGEIPRYESLLDLISSHRYDAHFGMDSVEPSWGSISKGEEIVKIANEEFYVTNGRLDLRNFFIQDLTKIEGLFSLKTLKDLDLSFNWIIEIPQDIGNLQSLEKLTIIESRVGKLPEEIGKLKNLKVLDVQGNYLETLPNSLEDSDSLETLRVSVFKYGDHSTLDKKIASLKNKGITVQIHDMHWLE